MKRMPIATNGAIFALALASTASSRPVTRSVHTKLTFIVWCDCDNQAKRTLIQEKVGHAGGKVSYVYQQIGGLAIIIPATLNRASVEKKLLRIPGVFAVQPDRVLQLGGPGGPQ